MNRMQVTTKQHGKVMNRQSNSAEEGGFFAKLFGSLSSEQVKARKAQEDLAMVWAENIRVPEGKTFSDYVDKLIPVLTRGTRDAKGSRKADLLAHLGWAYFLKSRDHSIILNETSRSEY